MSSDPGRTRHAEPGDPAYGTGTPYHHRRTTASLGEVQAGWGRQAGVWRRRRFVGSLESRRSHHHVCHLARGPRPGERGPHPGGPGTQTHHARDSLPGHGQIVAERAAGGDGCDVVCGRPGTGAPVGHAGRGRGGGDPLHASGARPRNPCRQGRNAG